MIEFYFPSSGGEWLAFASAAITALFGLVLFVAPRPAFRLIGLVPQADRPEAIAEGRARMAGLSLGVGLCALLFAQPLLYLALGAGWAFTAFGRLVSMLVDRSGTVFNWISLGLEIALAAGPILYGLSMI